MLTGAAALRDIDRTLRSIRNDMVRLDEKLSRLSDSVGVAQRYRLKLIDDIAAVRLAGLETGELRHNLGAADREAERILEQRTDALAELSAGIDDTNGRITDADGERDRLLESVNQVSQKIVDVESRVQAMLREDTVYLTQLETSRMAEGVAREATRKAEQAQADLQEKAEPYQQDKLFMYLWEADFGTTKYNAGPFTRFMDAWVAKLINYEPARVNYWNLTEIPQRLAEHADRIQAEADLQLDRLQQLEHEALASAGAPALEQQLEKLRGALDQHDDVIEGLEEELNRRLQERTRFVTSRDEYTRRCIDVLGRALEHRDLAAIQREVQATRTMSDDQSLTELRRVAAKLKELDEDLADVRQMHDRKISKLRELEEVRRNFKNARFDDVRSGFGKDSLVGDLLREFMQGVVTGAGVWRTIKRNQRYRDMGSKPDFGSGSLGDIGDILGGIKMPKHRGGNRRGSSWHIPKPRKGGGGFRTGGGF